MRLHLLAAATLLATKSLAFGPAATAQNRADRPGTQAVSSPAPGIARMREKFLKQRGVMVFAHRACWHYAPENSLSAMRVCEELGVDGIETDIKRTSDGHLVLMHDQTVDRTTNGRGLVSEMTLAQFKALRLRTGAGGPNAFITDEAPPTLAEALEVAKDRLFVDLDAKNEGFLAAVLEAKRVGLMDHVIIRPLLDPSDPRLQAVLDAAGPELLYIPTMRQVEGVDIERTAGKYRPVPPAFEINFSTEDYFTDGIRFIKGLRGSKGVGPRIWVNSLDFPASQPQTFWTAGRADSDAVPTPAAHWGRMIAQGMNAVLTNNPEAVLAYLKVCHCDPADEASK